MRAAICLVGSALLLFAALPSRGDDAKASGVNGEGFIQNWLVLAPIPFEGEGAAALDKEQVKDEAKLNPKAGDKVKIGDKNLIWKAHTCPEHLLDFNAMLGAVTEDSVVYAVAVIDAPAEMKVKMKTGSDDQAKAYLNGMPVFKNETARPTEKDQDTTDVTLKKGENVLVVKVVNEKVDWSFCVRFVDKEDKPVSGLKAKSLK